MKKSVSQQLSASSKWLVSLGSVNQTALDLPGNLARIRSAIGQCRNLGSQFLCLPELSLSGYGCEDMFLSSDFAHQVETSITSLLADTEGLSVLVGAPIHHCQRVYNAMIFIQDKQIVAMVAKKALAEGGVYYESRWFSPWTPGVIDTIDYGSCSSVPLGDIRIRLGSWTVGIEICQEAWASTRTLLAGPSCDVVFNPSASHFALGKNLQRRELVARSSALFGADYFYVNLLGVDSSRMIYEGSRIWGSSSKVAHEGTRFALGDVIMTHLQVDLPPVSSSHSPLLVAASADLAGCYGQNHQTIEASQPQTVVSGGVVITQEVVVSLSDKGHGTSSKASSYLEAHYESEKSESLNTAEETAEEETAEDKNREFFLALTLGLYDYLRKAKASCYVLSLSGGWDSSAVACLVSGMVGRALTELGEEVVCHHLPHASSAERQWRRLLLYCVYQKTAQNSEASEQAARGLAAELGASFYQISLQGQMDEFVSQLEPVAGGKLTWQSHGRVLENIQARLRSPFAWMVANLKGGILLCTANRSEAAMGYTTMDGDTSGGLAPISGIDKAFLKSWLTWVSEGGMKEFIHPEARRLEALECVLRHPPSAELRPDQQTDEAELMPYEVMAVIEHHRLYLQKPKGQVLEVLCGNFPQHHQQQLEIWFNLFMERWRQSQWKRERMAVGFHVSDFNVDPKSWCRYPVLSGPYDKDPQSQRNLKS